MHPSPLGHCAVQQLPLAAHGLQQRRQLEVCRQAASFFPRLTSLCSHPGPHESISSRRKRPGFFCVLGWLVFFFFLQTRVLRSVPITPRFPCERTRLGPCPPSFLPPRGRRRPVAGAGQDTEAAAAVVVPGKTAAGWGGRCWVPGCYWPSTRCSATACAAPRRSATATSSAAAPPSSPVSAGNERPREGRKERRKGPARRSPLRALFPLRRGKQRYRGGHGAGAGPLRGPRRPGHPQRPAGGGRRPPHPHGEGSGTGTGTHTPTHTPPPPGTAPWDVPGYPRGATLGDSGRSRGTSLGVVWAAPGHLRGHPEETPMAHPGDNPQETPVGTLRGPPGHPHVTPP